MTHAEFEMELIEALNMLLEDERASVEMEVALASGATEYGERDTLTAMGSEDIHFCEQLRTEMELAGLPVSPQINGIVFQVIGAERYDDRLRAFAHHQRVVADHAAELQESNLEGSLREALEGITVTHARHTEWTERRAAQFAATRLLDFSGHQNAPLVQEDASIAENLPADSVAIEEAPIDSAPSTVIATPLEPEEPAALSAEVRAEAFESVDMGEAHVPTVPVVTEASEGAQAPRSTRARAPRAAASGAAPKGRVRTTTKAAPKPATAPRRTRKPSSSDASSAE